MSALRDGTLPPMETLSSGVLRVTPVLGNADLPRFTQHYVLPADRAFLVMQPYIEIVQIHQKPASVSAADVPGVLDALFSGIVCGAEVSGKPIFEAPWGAIPTEDVRTRWWAGYPIFPKEHVALYLRWADRAAAAALGSPVDVRLLLRGMWVDE